MTRKLFTIVTILGLSATMTAYAGNPDRAGSAGATQLLINPWVRSSGWGGANFAKSVGAEAIFQNVAGVAFTEKTEIIFSRTDWLSGTDVSINALGLSQRVGATGALGISVMTMGFGDIQVTTTELPEGGLGEFSPVLMNIGLSYAKSFSESIYGGITARIISESIADLNAQGIAFDAGIGYVTGEKENVRFGIALKNVGPPMQYTGDGVSFSGVVPLTGTNLTVEHRTNDFEIPSLVNIGFAYDFYFGETHELTGALGFTSNSFTNDQFRLGAEYRFKSRFHLRGGYVWEDGITNDEERTSVLTGPTAGFTVDIPTNQTGGTIGLDYSYRTTNPFDGVHSVGVRVNIK